jgi:hypothetical protein
MFKHPRRDPEAILIYLLLEAKTDERRQCAAICERFSTMRGDRIENYKWTYPVREEATAWGKNS